MTATVTQMRRPEAEPGTDAEWVERIWKAYPSPGRARSSKARCRAKLLGITSENGAILLSKEPESGKLMPLPHKATWQEIYEGVVNFEKFWRKPGIGEYGYRDDGRFIEMMEKWLNRGGWES